MPARVERGAASHHAWVIADSGAVTGFAVAARKSPVGAESLWIAVAARRGLSSRVELAALVARRPG